MSTPPPDPPDDQIWLDDEGRAMIVNSHHYTAENIGALISELKRLEDPQQTTLGDWNNKDWRTWSGVLWRVLAAMATDVPLAPQAAEPSAWLYRDERGGPWLTFDAGLQANMTPLYAMPGSHQPEGFSIMSTSPADPPDANVVAWIQFHDDLRPVVSIGAKPPPLWPDARPLIYAKADTDRPEGKTLLDPQDAQKRIDSLRAALNQIAYSRWSTETPGQFVEALQKMARDALIDYASARRAKDRLAQHTSGTPSPKGEQA